jgi:hypothetical protein
MGRGSEIEVGEEGDEWDGGACWRSGGHYEGEESDEWDGERAGGRRWSLGNELRVDEVWRTRWRFGYLQTVTSLISATFEFEWRPRLHLRSAGKHSGVEVPGQ